MSLPLPDFATPAPTIDLTPQLLHWSELPSVAEAAPLVGEIVEGAEVAAAAAVLAEPALIVGAGLLAGAAAEAILGQFKTPVAAPARRTSPGGGRIGGNYIANFKYKFYGEPERTNGVYATGPVSEPYVYGKTGTFLLIGLLGGGVLVPLLSADPSVIEEFPQLTSLDYQNGGSPITLINQPVWVNPGTYTLPPPTVVPFPVGDGSTNININWQALPAPSTYPGNQPSQPINIGINVFSPELGVMVKFSPVGVELVYTNPATSTSVVAPPLPGLPGILYPELPCPCPEVNTTEIICRLKALESGLLDDGYEYDSSQTATGQGGDLDTTGWEPYYVDLNITQEGKQERTQRAAPGQPTVWFIGWYAWKIDGKPSDRNPISYLNQHFIAPKNATGFCWSLHDGSTGTATLTKRRKKAYVDHC